MTTTRRFFSGDNLERAIMQAARHHHLLPEQVAYTVVEKRHGFLKIRRGVVISVDPESPAKGAAVEAVGPVEEAVSAPSAPSAPQTERPRPERAASRKVAPWHLADEDDTEDAGEEPVDAEVVDQEEAPVETQVPEVDDRGDKDSDDEDFEDDELDEDDPDEEGSGEEEERFELGDDMAEGAREAIEQLLEFVNLEDMAIEIREGEDRLEIELSGAGQERLLEDRGALLLAVEHLVPRLLRGILGRSAPCRVDCAEFHLEREQRLEDMAMEAAEEARRRQRPRTLAPMSPEERRIVHMMLADDPDIRTESQGRGFFKRVTVSPVRHRSRVYD